ncbi:MAG: transcriptional regulator [Actinomycetota bacterium]
MNHPAANLHDVVHQRVRLGLLAILEEAGHASFTYLKEALNLTDGNLARHLQVLEEAGMVKLERTSGKRPRTAVKITRRGRHGYRAEIEVLKELVLAAEGGARVRRPKPAAERP